MISSKRVWTVPGTEDAEVTIEVILKPDGKTDLQFRRGDWIQFRLENLKRETARNLCLTLKCAGAWQPCWDCWSQYLQEKQEKNLSECS